MPRTPLAAQRWKATALLAAAVVALLVLRDGSVGQNPGPPKKEPAALPAVEGSLPADWVKPLTWRNIGPANMGGRITAISVYEADPSIYYVATASGGLLKTTNNGVTFEHQFDREATVSIGDVCVAPSNKDIVWVGTGEGNPRNSVSYGDGVYKSTDGGKTWKNMGLKRTFQIGRIAIHPKNPDIVYVGALGRLYGPDPDRGLYKTTDGGASWEQIHFLDNNTGVIDLALHPTNPDTLLVAAWERKRDGFDSYHGPGLPEGYDGYDPIQKWGPNAGIYKTTDGGKSFKKLTTGLPTSKIGRVGLDYYRKNPNVVFAIVDCEKIGMGTAPKKVVAGTGYLGVFGEDADGGGARLTAITEGGPAAKAGLMVGDVIKGLGKKKIGNYQEFVADLRQLNAGDKVALQLLRGDKKQDLEVTLGARPAGTGFGPGGVKPGRPFHAYYGGQKENVQDQQGPDSFEYGGVYKSTDGGESWQRVNSLNPRPMYFSLIRVDPTDDNHVYVGGIAVHRSGDGGKTFKSDGGKGVHADHHALWINPRDGRHMLIGTDGGFYATYDRMNNWDHLNHLALGQFYHVAVCTKRPYWVYGGLQDNGTWGGPSMGFKGGVGPINEDWVSIFGGDGYVCRVDPTDPDLVYFEMQDGGMGRRHLRTGEFARIGPVRGKDAPVHRFNWNTPYILSHHNPKIFYAAGEYVFRSVSKGDHLKIISPEITLTKRGSGTAVSESPKNPDVLWAGTDDGALWVTRNGGKDWTNLTTKVGLKQPLWVATIEASRQVEGRAYVAFDGHRSDDDAPHLFVTEDYGATWKDITANLPPVGSTRCLREDVENPNLLYCGTEFGVYASVNRGGSWTKLNNNLPTVAVHEIAVHPTAGEIVAATHGRSLWILDVTALRQVTTEALQKKAFLYKPGTAVRWQTQPSHGKTNRRFVGQNPPAGAQLYYSLTEKATKVVLQVVDIDGKTVATLPGSTAAGLHKVSWNTLQGPVGGGKGGKGGGGKKGGQGLQGPRAVPPGMCRVVLEVDGNGFGANLASSLRIEGDPNVPVTRFGSEEDELRKALGD